MKTAVISRLGLSFLFVAAAACGGDNKTQPLVPTTIAATSGTTLTAVAGTAVAPAPSVIVHDQDGAPYAGAPVTFAVASGGGTVTGGSVTTDANGVATVGEWKLGNTAGANTLTATAGSLSVTFSATGTVGPAASMTVSAGNNQVAAGGTAVATPPAVLVQDAGGNVKAGVTVTFAVGSGGGSVTGASATTNASGIATVGSWTLGPNAGANTLVASTTGVPSVTFTATATNPKCAVRTSNPFGSTTAGTLESNDCVYPGGYLVDFFSVALPDANAYLFRQLAGFDTYLDLSLADGTLIAENDDVSETNATSEIKALLPAGNYLLGASSAEPGVTGNYTVTSQVTSTENTNCEQVFTMKGVSTSQRIVTSDCLASQSGAPPIYGDVYYILLRAGQSVTVNMSSSEVDSFLGIIIVNDNPTTVAQNDNRDASTKDARITYTATVSAYYAILARTAIASQTGAYSLTIQ